MQATPLVNDGNWYGEAQYGFYDLEITKDWRGFESSILKPHILKRHIPEHPNVRPQSEWLSWQLQPATLVCDGSASRQAWL